MPSNAYQIITSPNPYLDLGFNLTEHKKILDNLLLEDKKTIAEKIVKLCPQKDFNLFRYTIDAIRDKHQNSFYAILCAFYKLEAQRRELAASGKENSRAVSSQGLELHSMFAASVKIASPETEVSQSSSVTPNKP